MITSSALFTRNLMQMSKRKSTFQQELWLSRVFSVCFAAAGVGLTFIHADVPAAMRFMFNLVPLIGILVLAGALVAAGEPLWRVGDFIASSIALILGMYVFDWTGNKHFPTLITFYLICGVGAGVVTSLLTKPEPVERLDRFFLTINTPIGQEHKFEGMKEAA